MHFCEYVIILSLSFAPIHFLNVFHSEMLLNSKRWFSSEWMLNMFGSLCFPSKDYPYLCCAQHGFILSTLRANTQEHMPFFFMVGDPSGRTLLLCVLACPILCHRYRWNSITWKLPLRLIPRWLIKSFILRSWSSSTKYLAPHFFIFTFANCNPYCIAWLITSQHTMPMSSDPLPMWSLEIPFFAKKKRKGKEEKRRRVMMRRRRRMMHRITKVLN